MIGERMEGDTVVRYMFHGTTIHGGQRFCTEAEKTARWVTPIAPAGAMDALVLVAAQQAWQDLRSQPLTYFHRQGRIGQVIQVLQEKRPRPRVAVLGMGAGTLAAYAEPGWQISFFEIDPAVVRIAEDPAYFTYVHDCRERIGDNNVKVILGDGRIKVWQQEDRTYDLLFMDAFSSDSVPVHLITKEALNIYFEKLAPGGILVVNIANRYLNLAPVLANLAEATGRQAVVGMDSADPAIGKFESNWVLLARDWADFGAIRDDVQRWPTDTDRHWRNLLRPPSAKDLTDSNLADWKKDFLFRSRFEQQLNEAAVRSWRQAIDRESPAEIRSWIQAEIDRAWERENARRQRIGVWRDDFSNLLRVLN